MYLLCDPIIFGSSYIVFYDIKFETSKLNITKKEKKLGKV